MPEKCGEECVVDIGSSSSISGYRDEIFRLRYAFNDLESWEDACLRTASFVGSAENGNDREAWIEKFNHTMRNFYFIPGGRVIRNAGRKRGMLLNCFVLGVDDNIESIGQLYKDALIVSATGGGVGVNFSRIRPEGDTIFGKGGQSSGATSFIDALDGIAETVESGGQRRAAFIGILGVGHPEIFKFIRSKVEEGKLSHFNISVGVTNDFLKAVKRNKNWELRFGNKVYDTVKARELWNLIIHNAWKCGDPGLVNMDNLRDLSPLYYCEEIESTNPCGEIPLPRHGSCCLGSINLAEMYNPSTNNVNWTRLKDTVETAVRFLDDVLDVTYYPIKSIELASTASRRIGLGVMGLHYLLLKMGIKRYGSHESLEFMDEFFNKLRDYAYLASIGLAKEKGAFEKYNADKYMEGAFAKTLPRRVLSQLSKFGIRNGAVLTMPPTGTTSMVAGVSSGIESIFAPVYKRKFYAESKKLKERTEVDPLFLQFVKEGKDTSHFIGAYNITPHEHMEVQNTCQKYVGNSISKTINMTAQYPEKDLSDLLLEHLPHIKGTTLYRQGSKGVEIFTPIDHTKMSKEEIIKLGGAEPN